MKVRLVKPVKHDLNSCSSVFTPVSSISKTKILSGKILPDTGYYRIAEFYQIPVSGTSLQSYHNYTIDQGSISWKTYKLLLYLLKTLESLCLHQHLVKYTGSRGHKIHFRSNVLPFTKCSTMHYNVQRI